MIFGYRGSTSGMVWRLVMLLLMLQLFSVNGSNRGNLRLHSSRQELQHPDEEDIQAHVPHLNKNHNSLVDEFLNENSSLRHVFFPGINSAIDPVKDVRNGKYYRPGRIWLDTDGNPIQAHGGGVLFDEISHTFYWYGEYRTEAGTQGVGCYSSKDLWTWKNQGIVFSTQQINQGQSKTNLLERPKVIYNDKTKKYVMWMHVDDSQYVLASVGVAISDSPTGPFELVRIKRPHGCESRDMTIFKDDDGVAYLIYDSRQNYDLHIGPLTDDYLDVKPEMKKILVGEHREAASVFKYKGTYHMITSACTGWAPNEASVHGTETILGTWMKMGDPCVGGKKLFRLAAYLSQSTFVIPLPGIEGSYIFMADRWNSADLKDSRYLWLPLSVGSSSNRPLEFNIGYQAWPRPSIFWHNRWRLPLSWSL